MGSTPETPNDTLTHPNNTYPYWTSNEKFHGKNDIKSLYEKIQAALNFEIDNVEQETIIDTYNKNREYNQQINETPNNEQSAIIKKFEQVLQQDRSSLENENDKPSIFLLTGAPGAGKSYTVRLIMDKAKSMGKVVVGTSYNGIAAVNINGDTISGLLNQYRTDRNNQRKDNTLLVRDVKNFSYEKMAQFIEKLQIDILSLLIVDEISTVSPIVLATLDIQMRLATKIYDKPFGGVLILFVGDFSQLPPKMGFSLTRKLLSSIKIEKEKMSTSLFSNLLANNKEIEDEDKYLWQRGCNVFRKSQWFHLTKQQRSNDDEHINFLNKMGEGKQITVDELKMYKCLSYTDLHKEEWLKASFLVSTNCERCNIIKLIAPRIAKQLQTHVVSWQSDFKNWQQKPSVNHIEEAKKDPALWEYFVAGTEGFINKNIQKKLGLANGTKIKYHSIVPVDTI